MVQKTLLAISLILAAPSSFAISNIENERPNLPEQGLSGSFKVSLAGKTGNQEENIDDGAAKIFYRRNNEIIMLLIEKEYGTKLNVKNTDNSFLHSRWTHLLTDKWSAEAFAQWEKDEFDNLNSRVLTGGGGRYLLAQEKNIYAFAIGLGAFREVEKQNLISYQETKRLWRINTYYSYKYQLNDQFTFVNTAYAQPSTSDIQDIRLLFDLGFNVKLTNSLQLSLNYKLTYDSEPAKNLEVRPPINNYKTNTEYKTAISYTF